MPGSERIVPGGAAPPPRRTVPAPQPPPPAASNRPAPPAEALAPPAPRYAPAPAAGLSLALPTPNDGLLHGHEATFYQRLDRETVPGLRRHGWEGGRYGFVRNVAQTPAGPVFTRVHQGIDIAPRYRDGRGEPLDTIRAVAPGRVVYVNRNERQSSYGLYVVLEHEWDGSSVYSLYAHLSSIWVRPGEFVGGEGALGRMGYTGTGLNRARAHLHLEIALQLNEHFQTWFAARSRATNHHGAFNGQNLQGVDPAALFLALRDDPALTFAAFVRAQPVAYRLALPGGEPLDLFRRYPWLAVGDVSGSGAWLVSFTQEGVPVAVARQSANVSEPQVVYVSDTVRRGHLSTRGILAREGSHYRLTAQGRSFAALLQTTARGVPRWFGGGA